MTEQDLRAAQKAANSNVQYVEGIMLDGFNMLELAAAIEHEMYQADGTVNKKITIHLDAMDALAMAKGLRKLALIS